MKTCQNPKCEAKYKDDGIVSTFNGKVRDYCCTSCRNVHEQNLQNALIVRQAKIRNKTVTDWRVL